MMYQPQHDGNKRTDNFKLNAQKYFWGLVGDNVGLVRPEPQNKLYYFISLSILCSSYYL